MDKFQQFKKLGLKDREYCIIGGALELLRIRPGGDLDVVVVPQAFDRVVREQKLMPERSFLGSVKADFGDVEIFTDDGFGRTASEWIFNSQKVGEYRIGSIKDLIEWKKKLMNKPGRLPHKIPVDKKDIEALEKML